MNEYRMFVRRNKNQQPKGILVAKRNSIGQIVIGWSYVNRKAGDRFSKMRGLDIARSRVEVGTDHRVPHDVLYCARRFRDGVLCHAYDLSKESLYLAGCSGLAGRLGIVPFGGTIVL